jgi:hypothetical protein
MFFSYTTLTLTWALVVPMRLIIRVMLNEMTSAQTSGTRPVSERSRCSFPRSHQQSMPTLTQKKHPRLRLMCPCRARAGRPRAGTAHVLSTSHVQCNMCNTWSTFETSRCNTCNVRLKTNETLETYFWNTCQNTWETFENHCKHTQYLDKTLAAYVWNVCNI